MCTDLYLADGCHSCICVAYSALCRCYMWCWNADLEEPSVTLPLLRCDSFYTTFQNSFKVRGVIMFLAISVVVLSLVLLLLLLLSCNTLFLTCVYPTLSFHSGLNIIERFLQMEIYSANFFLLIFKTHLQRIKSANYDYFNSVSSFIKEF